MITSLPYTGLAGAVVTGVICVSALLTCCDVGGVLSGLALKDAESPTYFAVMLYGVADADGNVIDLVATPPLSGAVPTEAPLTKNWTVPSGVPAPGET